MESKKITQLATEVAPLLDDLTFIGDPITGQLKKVTLNQIAYIFGAGSAWGTITGLLSNQTDLQAALNLKANDSEVVHLAGNETITGFKQFTDINGTWSDYGIAFTKGNIPSFITSSTVNLYSDSGSNNIVSKSIGSSAKLLFDNSTQTYTFPATTGTIALTSDLSSYVTLGTLQTITGNKEFSGFIKATGSLFLKNDLAISVTTGYGTIGFNQVSTTSKLTIASDNSAVSSLIFNNASSYNYTFPSASGTIALTSNLASYVPYTGATSAVNLGGNDLTGGSFIANGISSYSGSISLKQNGLILAYSGYTTLSSSSAGKLNIYFGDASAYAVTLQNNLLTDSRSYDFPNASGTIALTSNLTNMVTGTGTTNYLPKFTGASTIGNSAISESGALMTIDSGITAFRFNASNANIQYNGNLTIGIPASYTAITFNSSGNTIIGGNLGLGNTPSAWSSFKALQINQSSFSGSGNGSFITSNAYFDGTAWIRISSDYATQYQQSATSVGDGSHKWNISASGASGSAISFTQAMTLTASGRLLLGTASESTYLLDVNGTGRFSGTSGAFIGLTINNTDATGSSRLRVTSTGGNVTDIISYSASHASRANQAWIGGDGSSTITVLQAAGVEFLRGTSTGAATFSSSVTAASFSSTFNGYGLTLNRTAITNYQGISYQTANVGKWFVGMRENLSSNNYIIYNESNGIDTLTLNASTSAATFSSNITATDRITIKSSAYPSNYYTSLRSDASAAGILQLGNNNDNYILAGNTNTGGYLSIRVNVSAESITSGIEALRLAATGAATFSGDVNIFKSGSDRALYMSKSDGTTTIQLNTNGVSYFTGGNVGIGTTSPTTYSLSGRHLELNDAGGGYAFYHCNSTNVKSFWAANEASALAAIFTFSAHPLTFGTSNTERMRITSGGNVGIGTSSPDGYATTFLQIHSSGGNSSLRLTNSTSGSTKDDGADIELKSDNLFIATRETGTSIVLATQATERMRITSVGKVGIGMTPVEQLDVNGGIRSFGGNSGLFMSARGSGPSYGTTVGFYTNINMFVYTTAIGAVGEFNMSNGTYTALSDINKKKDFEISTIGLNAVMQLKPTLYRMKTDSDSEPKQLGFLAQEVKELIPQAYVESGKGEDKFIGLNFNPIVAALVKAIQEQQAQIEELKALINK